MSVLKTSKPGRFAAVAAGGGAGYVGPCAVSRAAFSAAARNIYLEQPYGRNGLWTRLPDLRAPSLFVWGRQDHLVPLGFEHHVAESLPAAEHLELDCGHVPQLEAPRETHEALLAFLAG